MGRILIFLSLLSLSVGMAVAQTRTVTGIIKDSANGQPLLGVSILIQGSKNGASSNQSGSYRIQVPSQGATLVVSYMGYETKTVQVHQESQLDIEISPVSNSLEEVQVNIGYGTVRQKDLTGAVGSVGADVIAAAPVSSALEAITGRIAGVQIASTEGSPDAEMKIRVRGGGSITGDNNPLYIVDGFPVSSIADIAPSDIESINVLKDASSAAIYGSRGANGVIIVTTKSAKSGKVSLNYSAFGGIRNLADRLDVLEPLDYAKFQYELSLLTRKPENYTKYFGNYQDIDLYAHVPGNDWQDLVFGRTGNTFNQTISLSGGSDKTKYSVSHNYVKDKAIMQLSGFHRNNINFKLNHKPHRKISLDFGLRYSDTQINGGGANEQKEISSTDSRLKFAMIYPTIPISGLTNTDETDDEFSLYNPLESISDNDQLQKRKTFNLNAAASWEIVDNLRFKTEFSLDDSRLFNERFYGQTTYYVRNVPAAANQNMPALIFGKTYTQGKRSTNTLNYDFVDLLPKDHSLSLLGGIEYLHNTSESHTSTLHGFPSSFTFEDTRKLSAQGKANAIENFLYPDYNLLSFFGRANYDYKSKYLLSATFRADGSSKYSQENYWGYFPSMAAAWRISAEDFMESSSSWLNDLKLRASYGAAGNDNIPSGQLVQNLEVKPTTWVNGFDSYWAASKIMANPNLKWETTISRNLGLDFSLFNGRLLGTIDAYLNTTQDLLILFPVTGTGYDFQYRNMGETQNKGLEFSLNWQAVRSTNFDLNMSANISFNRNRVNSLGDMDNFTAESAWANTEIGPDFMVSTGQSVGRMYGYKNAGRYEVSDFSGYDATSGKWLLKDGVADASSVVGTIRPGTMKLMDLNGDHIVNISDRGIIGNANPLHSGGFNLSGRIYSFDFNAMFNWTFGNDIYNANKIEYTSTSKFSYRNLISTMAEGERWNNLLPDGTLSNDPAQLEEMNKDTKLWSPYMSRFVFSDWAVEDGSFLRLSTLTLGYTLPKTLTERVKIKNLRIYGSAYNVFTWTNYTGFDPEVSTRRRTNLTPGVDYSAYPKSRLFVMGVNLNF